MSSSTTSTVSINTEDEARLSKLLNNGVSHFIDDQAQRCEQHYNEPRLRQMLLKHFAWSKEFIFAYLHSRTQRALELDLPEINEARNLARKYIGVDAHDFFVTCVDGRNMPTVMFSKPPHFGGVLRAPAGAVTGFMEGQEPGTVFIDKNSFVVKQLVSLLKEKSGGTIFYGLDSHLGCAARGQIHATEGGGQQDGGVRSDSLSKIMTSRGILQLRRELHEAGAEVAEVVPTFFSYDPTTGGVVAGLELYVDEERVAKHGYTHQILDEMAAQGSIVRTIDLLSDPKVEAMLRSQLEPKSADFRQSYAQSLVANWRAITNLYQDGKGELFQTIYELMTRTYAKAGWLIGHHDSTERHSISERTLKQKTKFLLKNLVTRYSIAGTDKNWPFDSHQEEMVVITDGGYAPFASINAFAVFSRDLNALLTNTKLTIDLIRSLRRNQAIRDSIPEIGLTEEEFLAAPVIISNKSILKKIKPESWEVFHSLRLDTQLVRLNWDDPETLNFRRSDILSLISKVAMERSAKLEIYDMVAFVDGIYELFDRMRIMMKDKYFRQMILHGNIIICNTLVDGNRRPRYVAQFVV